MNCNCKRFATSFPARIKRAVSPRDVTAVEGEDYVDPGYSTVSFAPGQRSARILIPLVQDVFPEADEAFVLELDIESGAEDDIYRRIAVMIRDDD